MQDALMIHETRHAHPDSNGPTSLFDEFLNYRCDGERELTWIGFGCWCLATNLDLAAAGIGYDAEDLGATNVDADEPIAGFDSHSPQYSPSIFT